MKRKLIKQGSGEGLVIYLPREWIKKNDLIQGEEIILQEINNNIQISPPKTSVKKEISISLNSEKFKTTRVILKNYYNLGYKKININYLNDKIKENIIKITQNSLLGFEISDIETKNKIIELRLISEFEIKNINEIINKIFFTFTNSIEELINYFKSSKEIDKLNSKEKILNNSNKIDKFENISRRIIFNKLNEDYNNNLNYWNLISYLVIGDRAIKKLILEVEKINNNSIKIFEDFENIFKIIHKKIFLKKDLNSFEKYLDEINSFIELNEKNTLKSKEDIIFLNSLREISNYCYFMSAPIYGIITNEHKNNYG